MKIITSVTVIARNKDGKDVATPPGEIDLDEATANELIARGQAKTVADAKAEAKVAASGVQVQTAAKPRGRAGA